MIEITRRVTAHMPKRLPSRGADRIGLASEAALHGAGRIGLVPQRGKATLHVVPPSLP
jgi:hypothetical protein